MQARLPPESVLTTMLALLHRGFDRVTNWVTQLSWWKFFLFAALAVIAGGILQDQLFSGTTEEDPSHVSGRPSKPESSIWFDETGIYFNPTTKAPRGASTSLPRPPEPAEPPEPPLPPEAGGQGDDEAAAIASARAVAGTEPVHIELPPEIGIELSNAIEEAVDNAAKQKSKTSTKQASTWFMSFVWLLVLALFGTKALVGGKKRAEAETLAANAAAERESMQRQLSEAKMQMMQAQVEPHFLFNTLASVEYLIETNPPRASAMQRSLIQYLRAVLPQMRDNAVITNLGREVDMVRAYLNLLKMRMEERLVVDLQIPEVLRGAAFPPMMLQSMVENAIKHGLECKAEGGTLRVVAEVSGGRLRVIVSDDGVGFGVMPSDGTGLGLPTIRERLKLLHGEQGRLDIAPNTPSGVVATVEVPYQPAR
ncbi:sensor histidine kinase [Massilia glaciei]|uniref:Sensor histidine kinase n=1 Tax=Massilia glaciei TaxID=1524097 RepID=A0A2U2HGW5_9BURK|nr:histidine kinase [Massilia glaciei]PWF44675.1 sensor histidine kinase [Massilia glaciei]